MLVLFRGACSVEAEAVFTHQQLMLCAVDSEFLQPDGQVVDADASITVNVQDLEKHLQPVLLLSTPAG